MKNVVKRVFDLMFSLIALILLMPVFVIIFAAIRFDSKGSALFKQSRLSKNGKIFTMYKFRTMIENAEEMGTGLFNYANDFRVTKIGKFLRKSSLDELPQLVNILKGDMSLVGPRPPVSYELGNYDDLNDNYKKRFTVLPGITGLAQINGRNELSWDEKVKYDNQYIDLYNKYGILVDFKIILLTIMKVLKMKNVYETKDSSLENISDEELAKEATKKTVKKAQTK